MTERLSDHECGELDRVSSTLRNLQAVAPYARPYEPRMRWPEWRVRAWTAWWALHRPRPRGRRPVESPTVPMQRVASPPVPAVPDPEDRRVTDRLAARRPPPDPDVIARSNRGGRA